jgi:hypothetical protein
MECGKSCRSLRVNSPKNAPASFALCIRASRVEPITCFVGQPSSAKISAVPPGRGSNVGSVPATEVAGYFQAVLRAGSTTGRQHHWAEPFPPAWNRRAISSRPVLRLKTLRFASPIPVIVITDPPYVAPCTLLSNRSSRRHFVCEISPDRETGTGRVVGSGLRGMRAAERHSYI